MNDDQLLELILRASAYLDGDLDAVELARAEADPELMAEVERLRSLQAELVDVEPPTDTVREDAIAAALDEFDTIHATRSALGSAAVTPAAARVVPFRPRPAYARWLGVAAAVVAIGLLGVVVANGLGGGDDESENAVVAPQADTDNALDRTAPANSAASATAFAEGTAEAAVEESVAAAEAAPPTTVAAPAAAPEQTRTDDAADTQTAGVTAAPLADVPFDPDVPIADELALGSAGRQLVVREERGELPPTPDTRCPFEPPLAVLSNGLYQLDGDVIDVLIAVDRDTGETTAYDPDTCEVVAGPTR